MTRGPITGPIIMTLLAQKWGNIVTLDILLLEARMATSTVNISFQEELLSRIDEIAQSESRSRSELIREAARIYIERKLRWESVFSLGAKAGAKLKISEAGLMEEIREARKAKK